jgi:hypothetical protein
LERVRFASLDVEVVRRLVEQQEVGSADEQRRECDVAASNRMPAGLRRCPLNV